MNAGAFVGTLAAVVAALALMLGAAFLLLRLARRWTDRPARAADHGQPIRFLRAMAVGQRERIALVEVRGDILLIGVTSGAVSLLARWPAATAAPACADTPDGA